MDNTSLLDIITIDDLEGNSRRYADIIGLENLIKMAKEFGGTQIYIPKLDELSKGYIYKQVINEFESCPDVKRLAVRHNLSESTVRRLVGDRVKTVRKKPVEGQLTID